MDVAVDHAVVMEVLDCLGRLDKLRMPFKFCVMVCINYD